MTPPELEAAARKRYDACPTVKPTWDQLGDVTRSVWRDVVLKEKQDAETMLQPQLPTRP